MFPSCLRWSRGPLLPYHAGSQAGWEPPPPDVPGRGSPPGSPGPLRCPLPHQPPDPRTDEPPRGHGALTCREPGSGAAPRSSRGSGLAGGRPAGGRAGRSARESPAPIAELLLLGPLNPRAAGLARRPPARRPASGPVASVGGRSERPRGQRPRGWGAAAARRQRRPDRAARVGGEGAVPRPLVTPAGRSLRPRLGAPPPQPLRARPRHGGGPGGGDEGNLKSLRSLPSAPPPQAPPPVPPPPVKSPTRLTGPDGVLADIRPTHTYTGTPSGAPFPRPPL